jgi:hypothetical protein
MEDFTRTVNQYGVDYVGITCPGTFSMRFVGATSNRIIPIDPHSGNSAYWSNKGDESGMTLTRAFDLTGITGTVSMSYWTWYDIEEDYDYLYVEASRDGQSWEILPIPSGTLIDPNGASFGWAYTGTSEGWIQETVDLSEYAGANIFIRFEYITDPAVNGEGFLLDDISIQVLGYETGFETEDDTWLPDGFVRMENSIPQTYQVALIIRGSDGSSTVMLPAISADQSFEIPITIGLNGIEDVVLVISGTSRYTRQVAPYQISIR